ncbi:MAG: hypothetical protein GY774_38605 [Planctomycetes bacterium]|nr:hypothetical protein [Planctomycetota bacterium]
MRLGQVNSTGTGNWREEVCMKEIRIISLALGVTIIFSCSTANADLMNGGFETGDLTGWSATGAAQAVDFEFSRDFLGLSQAPASGFWYPTEGGYFASLRSTDYITNVSTMSQTFTTPTFNTPSGAYELQFDYFYDFGDLATDPFLGDLYDPARIYVMDSLGNSVFDMTINDPSMGTELRDDVNIDWTSISVTLPTAGTYTLGFEIQDPSFAFESILGVDNVQVVPLPSAFLLGSIGLVYASWRLRKQKEA